MSIQEIAINIKRYLMSTDAFLALLLVLVAVASFGLGRMSAGETGQKTSIVATIEAPSQVPTVLSASTSAENLSQPQNEVVVPQVSGLDTKAMYVASKSGTKYHLPWCAGAKQIKEENKVWFSSKEEAEKAGYTAAANCKGI